MQMFYRFLMFAVLSTAPCYGVKWEIIGQDSALPVHQGTLEIDLRDSVGKVTVSILEQQKISYIGNEAGMNSILGTPTGEDAMVIVNDDTMRVYGWCYEVDGMQPDVMPDEFYFPAQASNLRWFYAFSLYEKGEWRGYCLPAHTHPLTK